MAPTQIASLFVANLQTTEKFFSNFTVEVWNATLSSLVQGPFTVQGIWISASGAWIQTEPLVIEGLQIGTTYQLRSRVHTIDGGIPSPWTAFATIVVGNNTPPVVNYTQAAAISPGGIRVFANPTFPPANINHYEFYYNTTNSLPAASTLPNLPNSNTAEANIVLSATEVAYVWVRAIDTGGNAQAWTSLGGFNSNGQQIEAGALGVQSDNLVKNGDFELGTANWQSIPLSGGLFQTAIANLPRGSSEFLATGGQVQLLSQEFIPVDVAKIYLIECWANIPNGGSVNFGGFTEYDSNQMPITSSRRGFISGSSQSSAYPLFNGLQQTDGYQYFVAEVTPLGGGIFGQTTFHPSTKYVRMSFLLNWTGTPQPVEIIGVRFSEVAAGYRRTLFATVNQFGQIDPSGPIILAKGNTPNSLNGPFVYSSTTKTITWSWTGLAIFRSDGTITPIPDGSMTIVGLNTNKTYYFYPYWDESLNSLEWLCLPSVSDDFQYGAGSVSLPVGNPAWVNVFGGFSASGGLVYASAVNGISRALAMYVPAVSGAYLPDQFSTLTIAVPSNTAGSLIGPAVRIAASGSFYALETGAGGTPASDSFTRANGSLGSNWTAVDGAFAISSNQVIASTGGGSSNRTMAYWNAQAFGNDQSASLQISTFGGTSSEWIGPAVRVSAGDNGYGYFTRGGGDRYLFKHVGGVETQLAGPSANNTAAGDILTLEVSGTTLTALRNGVVDFTVTDGSLASGSTGMFGNQSTTLKGDNWTGMTLAVDALELVRVIAGTRIILNSTTEAIGVGDTLSLQVLGNVLTGFVNGVPSITGSDNILVYGNPGIAASNLGSPVSGLAGSDWSGGDLSVGPDTFPEMTGVLFDGVNTFARGNLAPVRPTSWTVECWFQQPPSSPTATIVQFCQNSSGTVGDFIGEISISSAGILTANTGTGSSGAGSALVSPLSYNDGNWHHVAYTFDGTTATLYVDGVQVATGVITGSLTSFTGFWRLADGSNGFFNGMLSRVGIYSSPLTAQQVSTHYNTGFVFGQSAYDSVVLNDGVLYYWEMQEAQGASTLVDSADGNNGQYLGTLANIAYQQSQQVSVPLGAPSLAFTMPSIQTGQGQALQSRVAMSNGGVPGATTSSGTGGGSGGGSGGGAGGCFSPNARITTRRGDIPFLELKVGDEIYTAKGTWRPVEKVTTEHYEGTVHDLGGGEFVTSRQRVLADSKWKPVFSLMRHWFWYEGVVYNLEVKHDKCDNGITPDTERSFVLPTGWICHNNRPAK